MKCPKCDNKASYYRSPITGAEVIECSVCERDYAMDKQQSKRVEQVAMNFEINDNQKAVMNKFIERHNRSRKCHINKQKKRITACGGIAQYSIKITLSSIANVATIQCECGAKEYLGEV